MTDRVYNFSAGPATLPVEVLEEAKENIVSLGNLGIGILEGSLSADPGTVYDIEIAVW